MSALDDWGELKPYVAYLNNRARCLNLDPRLRARFSETELVSETFLRVQDAKVPFRGASIVERMAYLDQIFGHVFIDHLEKHHAEKRDLDKKQVVKLVNETTAEYRLEPADKGASPSEQAARRKEYLRAMECIDKLPEKVRDVILLIRLQELSLTEAAERLGVKHKGQVTKWYQHGITKLAQCMKSGTGA